MSGPRVRKRGSISETGGRYKGKQMEGNATVIIKKKLNIFTNCDHPENPTEIRLLKTQNIHRLPVQLLNARRIPQLNFYQWKQSIGRLNVGQLPQLVAHAFNCNVSIIQRLRERYITLQTVLMTVCVWFVIELPHHVRIDTFFDSTWIIDSLDPIKQHYRQLVTIKDQLVTTMSDVDWSPTI